MALEIQTVSPEQTAMTLALEGQLDAITAPDLDQFIGANLTPDITTLILDLGKLTFISSAGLRIFAKLRKTLLAQGDKLCFVNLSPQVEKVFEIVKAVPQSDVFRDLEELDEYLATMQRKVGQEKKV